MGATKGGAQYLKPCLRHIEICLKLGGLKNAKYFFLFLKPTSLARFSPKSKPALTEKTLNLFSALSWTVLLQSNESA
jgi:hypothetical protein